MNTYNIPVLCSIVQDFLIVNASEEFLFNTCIEEIDNEEFALDAIEKYMNEMISDRANNTCKDVQVQKEWHPITKFDLFIEKSIKSGKLSDEYVEEQRNSYNVRKFVSNCILKYIQNNDLYKTKDKKTFVLDELLSELLIDKEDDDEKTNEMTVFNFQSYTKKLYYLKPCHDVDSEESNESFDIVQEPEKFMKALYENEVKYRSRRDHIIVDDKLLDFVNTSPELHISLTKNQVIFRESLNEIIVNYINYNELGDSHYDEYKIQVIENEMIDMCTKISNDELFANKDYYRTCKKYCDICKLLFSNFKLLEPDHYAFLDDKLYKLFNLPFEVASRINSHDIQVELLKNFPRIDNFDDEISENEESDNENTDDQTLVANYETLIHKLRMIERNNTKYIKQLSKENQTLTSEIELFKTDRFKELFYDCKITWFMFIAMLSIMIQLLLFVIK